MTQSGVISQAARSTAAHTAFAFLAMGAWAAFANRTHGVTPAITAFLVQGALSALITLGLKRWLEYARRRLRGFTGKWAPPLISCLAIGGVLSGVHLIAGTPAVIATIALPWTVSTLYALIYAASLPETPG